MAQAAQQQIETGRRNLAFEQGTRAREFAQLYGAQQPAPTINAAPRVGVEGFERGGAETPLYELSPDVYSGLIGTKEFERRGVTQSRASELEQVFREQEAIKQARTLNL